LRERECVLILLTLTIYKVSSMGVASCKAKKKKNAAFLYEMERQ